MAGFDFEEDRLTQEIAKLGAKRVLLQLPEGLKPEAPRIAKIVESTGALAIISADPCYGACDLATDEAQVLGADLIVHFGHATFGVKGKVSTIYVEAKAAVDLEGAVVACLPLLRDYNVIGLATTVQHLQSLSQAQDVLEKASKTVVIGNNGQLPYAGQVIGCNYSNVKSVADTVDAFLFVGGGFFHALGIALSTSKPTFVADPYDNRAFSIDQDAQRVVRQRWTSIEEAKNSRTFGVLVGLKPGQRRLEQAFEVMQHARIHGRDAFLLAAREITPETLLEFPSIDAYVNTACPRISLEAPGKFSKPVLTANEFNVVVGETTWENLLKKGLFEN